MFLLDFSLLEQFDQRAIIWTLAVMDCGIGSSENKEMRATRTVRTIRTITLGTPHELRTVAKQVPTPTPNRVQLTRTPG